MISLSDVQKGITSIPEFVRKYGLSGGLNRWSGVVFNRATSDVDGRSIFEEDWDVCVILDACRADELERFQNGHDWLESVGRFPSIASCTWNWLPRTLERTPDEVLKNTTYVAANPFTDRFCTADEFYELDEVWRYAWNEEAGTVLPRPVTDRAIHHGRNTNSPRLLVHYVQPHVPFLTERSRKLSRSNFDHGEESVTDAWDRVTRGELSPDKAISRYRETLSQILEEVDLLLTNIDAEQVIITADHGEAFGEWGLYGHPPQIDLPCLTEVPWVVTTGTDNQTHQPAEYDEKRNEVSQAEQLKALGYVD